MGQHEINFEYDAFISYRHAPRDTQIAEKLHKALETYRTPSHLVKRGFPSKLKKVFRDREELPTSSDLGQDIENALMRSRYLIIICSPEAVQSKWVLREVEIFGEFHGFDKILTLLVDGEPSESFPPKLIRYLYDDQGALSKVIEPLAADIRSNSDASPLKLLKTEKLRLIASILGCRYDELRQRDLERRVRRIVAISASTAAFLLAVTAFTLWQLNEVNTARETAVKNEWLALDEKAKAQESEQNALGIQSELYASFARRAVEGGDRMLGMSLAMEALPKDLNNPERPLKKEAQGALFYSAVQYGMQELTYLYPPAATANDNAKSCFFDERNGDIVTVSSKVVRRFNTAGKFISEWIDANGYEILAISPHAERAVIAQYTSEKGLDVQLWDIPQNRIVVQQTFNMGSLSKDFMVGYLKDLYGFNRVAKAGFSPDGKTYYVARNEYYDSAVKSKVSFFDSDLGQPAGFSDLAFDYEMGDICFNGSRIVVSLVRDDNQDHKNIAAYDLQKNALLCQVSDDEFPDMLDVQEQSLGITSDGRYFSFVDASRVLHIVIADTGEEMQISTKECMISNDGNLAVYMGEGEDSDHLLIHDILNNKIINKIDTTREMVTDLGFVICSNNRYVVFRNSVIYDIKEDRISVLPETKSTMNFADSDLGGNCLVSLDKEGIAAVFQLQDPQISETVIPAATNEVAIRDSGVLLFETIGAGTAVRRWDAALKTFSFTAQEDDQVMRLCDITGGSIGFMSSNYSDNFDIFSMDTGRITSTFQLKFGANDFQVDPSGRYVIASNGGVFLYDAKTGRQIRRLNESEGDGYPSNNMYTVGFFPDGKHCWSVVDNTNAEGDTGIVINEIETGEVVSHIDLMSVGVFSYFCALTSSDGSRMVVCPVSSVQEDSLQLWSIDTQMNPNHICDIKGTFLCMDDSTVVTNDNFFGGDTVYIYDLKTGQLKATIKTHNASDFYGILVNGGKNILTINAVSSGPKHIVLWDCDTGKAAATLYTDYIEDSDILDFGLINGGKEIAVVSMDNRITYIRTIPFPASFEDVYNNAKEKLAGRTFDIEQDMDHIQ